LALVAAGQIVYSQTTAFTWDEGFHLLAAQLIRAGKSPYLDFCFPQAPLNAYWTAAWMGIFGESWRTAHAVSAALTAAAVWLVADYVYSRMPASPWRLPAAGAAALLAGLNNAVFEYGVIGQAYGMCMFATAAAFRVSVAAAGRKRWPAAALAGFLAGVAADSSLLAASAAPVLLVWMAARNREGRRWAKAIAFLGGAALAFLPAFRLFLMAPRRTLFNLFQYQMLYRSSNWTDAGGHDLEVLTSWIDSGSALLLILLAAAGLLFLRAGKYLEGQRRSEFYLCAWLAAALAAESAAAHPTFERYFVLAVPFMAILAAVGFVALASAVPGLARPALPAAALAFLLLVGWGKGMHDRSDVYTWNDIEQVARKVREVAPPGKALWADENIYFLNHRVPPSGMEFAYSHLIESLAADRARFLHVLPRTEIKRRVEAGAYDAIETCDDDVDFMTSLDLAKRYRQRAEVAECAVYWDKSTTPPVSASKK
jgi:hypothetical protein